MRAKESKYLRHAPHLHRAQVARQLVLVYPALQLVHVVEGGDFGRRAAEHRVRDVREHGLAHRAAHDVGREDGVVDAVLVAAARARLALADAVALICIATACTHGQCGTHRGARRVAAPARACTRGRCGASNL